jgi:hypothetical protein
LITQNRSRIVPAMTRLSLALLLVIAAATPALAQSTEFGLLLGGSRRFVDDALAETPDSFMDSSFSFSNGTVDLYWAMQIEPELYLKLRGGRIETQVPLVVGEFDGELIRRDEEGEVQHAEALIEYRFSEPFGSSGLFAGPGLYRHTAPGGDARTSWGFAAGVNADFPISRRYGVVVEGTYHWVRTDFSPRYLTVGAGLRIAF